MVKKIKKDVKKNMTEGRVEARALETDVFVFYVHIIIKPTSAPGVTEKECATEHKTHRHDTFLITFYYHYIL